MPQPSETLYSLCHQEISVIHCEVNTDLGEVFPLNGTNAPVENKSKDSTVWITLPRGELLTGLLFWPSYSDGDEVYSTWRKKRPRN